MYSLADILNLLLIIIPILFAFQLLTFNNRKAIPNRILGTLMIFVACFFFANARFICSSFNFCIINKHLVYTFFLSITPYYYLYTKSLTQENFVWKKRYFAHKIPALLALIMSILTLNFIDSEKLFLSYAGLELLSIFIYNIQVISYTIAMIILLRKHSYKIKNNFSFENEKINLNWLKAFIVILISFTIIDFSLFYAISAFPEFDFEIIYYSLVNLFYIFVGYFGLKQTEIYSIAKNMPSTLVEDKTKEIKKEITENIDKEKKQTLPDIKSKEIFSKIIDIVEKEELYKNPELSIYHIAKKLNINKTYLSYSINNETNDNFSTFINKFRIKEAKKLLENEEYDYLTIEAIASNVGFHSRSSINSWFKKLTNKTPSQYKKEFR